MPTSPPSLCLTHGCGTLVYGGGRCDLHTPAPWAGSTRAKQRPIGWAKIRARVLRRDNNTCRYCGGEANEVDHIIPVSRGGSHLLSNLCASCAGCNASKNHEQRLQP